MAAKKAPAKKMAAPKAAPKKTGKTADSSKLTASQKKNLAASAKMRTDAAGRSGMGETATSNVRFKKGSPVSSANLSANAAGMKAAKTAKDPKNSYREYQAAYIKSMAGAGKYAFDTAPKQRFAASERAKAEAAAKKKKKK
jgi:hypothetical protein